MVSSSPSPKPQKNAIILLDKGEGVTSFSALNYVKRKVNRKTGHTGTLDKFASGLIIALCGKYTKYNDMFMSMDKTYIAQIEFGKETDTLDPEGEVIDEKPIPDFSVIKAQVSSYAGKIMQTPPEYSAIHVNGKRSYQMVRSGEKVSLEARPVEIYSAEILNWREPFLTVCLKVSKGTYVRSYARDLGRLCASCAYVKNLRRTEIGPFSVNDAIGFDDIERLSSADEAEAEEILQKLSRYKTDNNKYI